MLFSKAWYPICKHVRKEFKLRTHHVLRSYTNLASGFFLDFGKEFFEKHHFSKTFFGRNAPKKAFNR